MNFKTPLLFAIVGLAVFTKPAFAETSPGSGSTGSAVKPAGQTDAKASTTAQPEGSTDAKAGGSTVAHPEESTNAQPKVAPQGPKLFKLIDTDKDGRISLAEYVAYGKAAEVSAGSEKTSANGDARTDSSGKSTSSNARNKSDAAKTDHSDKSSAAVPEPDSPGPSLLPSVSTRADKFTAEVFENLDIDHDKFLSQAELDALIGAHQISQP